MLTKRFAVFALLLLALCPGIAGASKKPKPSKSQSNGFSYYMLVLSYAPDFCNETGSKDPGECGNGRHVGFVVHGLWPQGETTRGPENCASQGEIPDGIFTEMLRYFPTKSLIQHEWTTHGTCSGLIMAAYFAAVKKARDAVTIPSSLVASVTQAITPAEVISRVAAANSSFLKTAFRTSCYKDSELQEVRVCLNKDLSPRPCSSSAGQCPAKNVTLLPVH